MKSCYYHFILIIILLSYFYVANVWWSIWPYSCPMLSNFVGWDFQYFVAWNHYCHPKIQTLKCRWVVLALRARLWNYNFKVIKFALSFTVDSWVCMGYISTRKFVPLLQIFVNLNLYNMALTLKSQLSSATPWDQSPINFTFDM